MPKRIALVGGHTETKLRAPFGDPEWTIWACAPSNQGALPRVDAWFEVHVPAFCASTRPQKYMDYLKTLPVVYMRDRENHPNALAYPDQEMKERFGVKRPDTGGRVDFWFKSSIAYMLAYAISKNPVEIGMWGIHQANDANGEYKYQRPSTQRLIEFAWEAGITVTVPPGVKLLKPMRDNW